MAARERSSFVWFKGSSGLSMCAHCFPVGRGVQLKIAAAPRGAAAGTGREDKYNKVMTPASRAVNQPCLTCPLVQPQLRLRCCKPVFFDLGQMPRLEALVLMSIPRSVAGIPYPPIAAHSDNSRVSCVFRSVGNPCLPTDRVHRPGHSPEPPRVNPDGAVVLQNCGQPGGAE